MRTRLVAMVAFAVPLMAQAPRTLTLIPDLRIDGDKELFIRAGAVLPQRNGDIVLTTEPGMLRFYNSAGVKLGTFGRVGEGPDEFKGFIQTGQIADTLFALDGDNRRLTYVGLTRKSLHMERMPVDITLGPDKPEKFLSIPMAPRVMYPNGDFLFQAGHIVKGVTAPWLPEAQELSAFVRTDHAGVFKSRVAVVDFLGPVCSVDVRNGNSTRAYSLPNCPRYTTLVARDGSRIAVVTQENREPVKLSATFHVVVLAERGDTVYSRNYPYTPVALPKGKVDSVIDAQPAAVRGDLRSLKAPQSYAPVYAATLGADGTVWIRLWTPITDGPQPYLVLDPKGNVLGTASLPKRSTLSWATASTIYAWQEDDDGVPSLVRYRVK